MTTENSSRTERVASLDLLRGVAALAVAVPHFLAYRQVAPEAAETISAIAVEVFFVLSGYVLAPQILFCLERRSPRHLGVFLARRWMRTIPPYLVALLAISVLSHKLASADFWRYLTYTQNLFRQSNANDYFAIAWSLSVEEWFYVTFPALLLGAGALCGRGDRRFAVLAGIAVCAAIVAARALFGDDANWGAEVRRVVIFRLDSIGYGFLLYLAVERAGAALDRFPAWVPALLLLPASVLAYASLEAAAAGSRGAAHAFPFAAMAVGALAIVAAVRAEHALDRVGGLAGFGRYLGRISYSAYLFHIILIELIVAASPGLATGVQLALFLAVLFAFTTGFFYGFEQPILAARPRYRTTPSTAGADLRAAK